MSTNPSIKRPADSSQDDMAQPPLKQQRVEESLTSEAEKSSNSDVTSTKMSENEQSNVQPVIDLKNNVVPEKEKSSNFDVTSTKVSENEQSNVKPPINSKKNVSEKEVEVGISEYISDLPGFSAVIKERYSDFQVCEIDLDGKIVHLTALKELKDGQQELPQEVMSDNNALNETELNSIKELEQKGMQGKKVIIDVTDKNKDERRLIHELIREKFKGLESITESVGETKNIVVARRTSKSRTYKHILGGNYTHFVLYKENRDTMNAISTIAATLKLMPKAFAYAGTKDKRGKTVQCVSASRVLAHDLLALNRRLGKIKIGNVVYKSKPLRLGDLSGNHFVAVLRQFKGNVEDLDAAMTSLSTRGFINYYGLQRFGTANVATHRIGKALLTRKWQEAIDLILRSRGDEASEAWIETKDPYYMLEKLQHRDSIEGRLLGGIIKHNPNDFVNALNAIPRNTRLMYVHSYQSYIWNKVVSRRIQQFGLEPQVGDLVLRGLCIDNLSEDVIGLENVELPKARIDVRPKVLTAENLHNYDIYDVVLPLPGHSIRYPNNCMKLWYEELLKEDGMNYDSFKNRVKAFSLFGAYRKILVKPRQVKWEMLHYDDNTKPLILSDFEILNGEKLEIQAEGALTALKVEFSLPPSAYATMAMREVLKKECL